MPGGHGVTIRRLYVFLRTRAYTHAHAHARTHARTPRMSLSPFLSRAPRGGVTRQDVVLTDLQALLDCQ
jgi:hypothetical protein